MLLALPIVLLVNMAKKMSLTQLHSEITKEEGPNADKPAYYMDDDDDREQGHQ